VFAMAAKPFPMLSLLTPVMGKEMSVFPLYRC
jgi:hypothetical protein